MERKNKVLEKLISLNKEWSTCLKRIDEIQEELKPIIIERYKQLDYKEETVPIKARLPKGKFYTKNELRGIVNWKETFIDEDTGNKIEIDRSRVVMRDGVWDFSAFDIEELINW